MAAGWWTCDETNGLVARKRQKKRRGPTAASEVGGQEVEVNEQGFAIEVSGSAVVCGVTVEWVAAVEWRTRLLG